MDLEILGFGSFFDEALRALGRADLEPARVVRSDRGALRVETRSGLVTVKVTGRLLHEALESGNLPVVGDWVAVRGVHGATVLHAVLPRRTRISRQVAGRECREQVLAANVDTVFVVSGLDGDFNPRRIERYLTLVADGGATPVIVLNKLDLATDPEAQAQLVERMAPGIAVTPISARDGVALERLAPWLGRGSTVALVGSSGAGKSTLVNRLLGQELARIGEVRDADGRGRHTTSHRELFVTATGASVVDTPGLREVQLWGGEEDLAGAFRDLEALALGCRFGDCGHQAEPGCAVRAAIDEGRLDRERLESWAGLKRELAWLERKREEHSSRADSRRQGREYKSIQRAKRVRRG